jgi:hypothetical protein
MQCPRCQAPLATGVHACPNCGLSFASDPSETREQPALGQNVLQDSQPSGASQGISPEGAPVAVQDPQRKPGKLRRFQVDGAPLWTGIVALIPVGVALCVSLFSSGKDWAESASIAAYVALAGAGVILLTGVGMLALRRFRWLTLGLSMLLLVALSISGAVTLANQPAIHLSQARAGGQWAMADGHPRISSGRRAGA